ncbi:MAG: beta-ketoacyl-[acyl-carrier-protein] synthase family protein [Mangrovibacterium sp.]|nr:beta-ketoacyl-[acyl-carrier-protein] synthase family protein [Mangrovibacterium sp.]
MAIVITGFEIQSPLGSTLQENLSNLRNGSPCVGAIQNIDTEGFTMKAAGEYREGGQVLETPPNIDRKVYFLDQVLKRLFEKTGIDLRYDPSERLMNIGSGVDYIDIAAYFLDKEYEKPMDEKPHSYYKTAGQIKQLADHYQIAGGCNIFAAACVASAQAIGLSYRMLKHGMKRAIITGGSESMISYVNYIGFYLLGAMSADTNPETSCKPFDRRRSGTVLGEGTAMLLLENSSLADPESIIAEIAGYGCTMDAYAITDPDPSAKMLAKAIELALDDAGVTPDVIDCVHLHGTGTPKNAPAEYLALRQIFGDRVSELPVYSMKGQIGHLIGSCTAVEMLGVIHSIQNQEVLPTLNFAERDPEAPLFVVQEKPLSMPINYVLKLNSAFGGHNTALVIKKHNNS